MSKAPVLSVPPVREGFVQRTLRRVRWSFGWIKPADLTYRTDVELMVLAEDFVRRKRLKHASMALSAFGQRTTMDPKILQRYGDVSRSIGAHDAAIFSYLQAAELYLQQGHVGKACALLQSIVRVYPGHVDARLALARVFETMTRKKEAAACYAVVAKIFEQHGQLEAARPLLAKIAELWPQARADYRGGPSQPPQPAAPAAPAAPAEPPKVVVGRPMRAGSVVAPDRDAGPIELDLDSLISAFAIDAEGNPVAEKDETTIGFDGIDAETDSQVEVHAGPPAWAKVPPMDTSPSDRYAGLRDNEVPTSSYQAIDSYQLEEAAPTMMDMRAIDSSSMTAENPSDPPPGSDQTIMDLRAIVDPNSPAAKASRVIDKTENTPKPTGIRPSLPPRPSSRVAPRATKPVKPASFRQS